MMIEKRYKVHNMIKGMNIGESVDLELMKELTEKYGKYENVDVGITDNGKEMTYKEVVDLLNKNEQLRIDGLETIDELEKCRENNKKALKNLEIVFDVIDNKIKEFQDGEYGDLPCNTIHILLDLKEELSYEMSRT